jgi:hypothetical protein
VVPVGRDASRTTLLHYLPHILIALLVVGAFVLVWRAEGDDPGWEERWSALPAGERDRIAAAARSGDLLASAEEIELAAGFARRDRRRGRPTRLLAALDLPIGAVLILGGLLAGAAVFAVFGGLFLALGLFRLFRAHRVGRGLRETIARDRGY